MISPVDSAEATAVRSLTPTDAAVVAGWRYEGPWSIYDVTDPDVFSPAKGYWAIVEPRPARLVGFVCLGAEARVAGMEEETGVLDVGVGLDPARVGRGQGRTLLAPVVAWAEVQAAEREARALRAVIQSWNTRSLRLCRSLGFAVTGRHLAPASASAATGRPVEYLVLHRVLPAGGSGPA